MTTEKCCFCEEQDSVVRCSECPHLLPFLKQFNKNQDSRYVSFCADCDKFLHGKNKLLKEHETTMIEQICQNCDSKLSIAKCDDCEKNLCSDCNALLHSGGSEHSIFPLYESFNLSVMSSFPNLSVQIPSSDQKEEEGDYEEGYEEEGDEGEEGYEGEEDTSLPTPVPSLSRPLPSRPLFVPQPFSPDTRKNSQNEKKFYCIHFNGAGCRSGDRCRSIHQCSICNSKDHGRINCKPLSADYKEEFCGNCGKDMLIGVAEHICKKENKNWIQKKGICDFKMICCKGLSCTFYHTEKHIKYFIESHGITPEKTGTKMCFRGRFCQKIDCKFAHFQEQFVCANCLVKGDHLEDECPDE